MDGDSTSNLVSKEKKLVIEDSNTHVLMGWFGFKMIIWPKWMYRVGIFLTLDYTKMGMWCGSHEFLSFFLGRPWWYDVGVIHDCQRYVVYIMKDGNRFI